MWNNNFLLEFLIRMAHEQALNKTIIIMDTTRSNDVPKWKWKWKQSKQRHWLAVMRFCSAHFVHTCEQMKKKTLEEWKRKENEEKRKKETTKPVFFHTKWENVEQICLVTGHFHRSHLNFKSYRLNSVLFDFKMAFGCFWESVKLKTGAM